MENKPTNLDLLLYSVQSRVYAHHESLFALGLAVAAFRAAFKEKFDGFDEVYLKHSKALSQQPPESLLPIQKELEAMKATLEAMREALGLPADGSSSVA